MVLYPWRPAALRDYILTNPPLFFAQFSSLNPSSYFGGLAVTLERYQR